MNQGRLLYDWCFRYYGSSRSSAIMRILLSLVIFYRFFLKAEEPVPAYGPFWAAAFFLSFAGMLFGIYSRISTFVLGVIGLSTYYYFFLIEGHHAWAHHHTYIVAFATIVLSFAPCGNSYSVDRWLAVRRARKEGRPEPLEEGNLFALRLLAIQMVILYFYAFWDKVFIANTNQIFYGFLDGSRLEHIILFHYWGSNFDIAPWMTVVASIMAITVCLLELVLPLLLIERFQKWLVIPGIGLHIMFYVLLPLWTYSLTCIILYFAIFNANKVHGFIDALGPDRQAGDGAARASA